MFGPKNNKLGNSIERFDTIIGQSLRVEGNLIVSQAIRVDGYVNGNIFQADSETATVAVAEGAMVNGDIRASHVIISGKLKGNIFSTDRVEILKTAEIEGDIIFGSVGVEVGARVTGKLSPIEITEPEHASVQLIAQSTQQITA